MPRLRGDEVLIIINEGFYDLFLTGANSGSTNLLSYNTKASRFYYTTKTSARRAEFHQVSY